MTIHFSSVPATFRPIRRNGTTSFKHWARAHMPDSELLFTETSDGGLLHMTPEEISLRWERPGTTFGFVRNPYSRLVSGFHWIGQQANNRILQRKYNKTVPFTMDFDIKLISCYKKGFDWWINNQIDLAQKNLSPYGTMALFENPKQTQMFCWDNQVPDLVVKLENIEKEFIHVQELLDCRAPMFMMNASIHNDYRSYYTSETAKLVYKWVEQDLDTFGYTFLR